MNKTAAGQGQCPIKTAIDVINGKWKHRILMELTEGPVRYNQLADRIGSVSPKVLTQQLRELEADGLVSRTVYPEVPPRVEYALTDMGESIFSIFFAMRRWALEEDRVHEPVCSHCGKCMIRR